MREATILGLIFLLLAQNCISAAPLQLSGGMGRSILENVTDIETNNSINNTINDTANETSNLTTSDDKVKDGLWSWGKVPVGHSLNQSGKLITNPIMSDPTVEIPPKSPF